MILAIGINKNQKIIGHELNRDDKNEAQRTEEKKDDGTIIISTEKIAKDIMGYAGNTPLKIYIKGGIITNIEAIENDETPDFFSRLKEKKIFSQWIGLTIENALQAKVDATSGATLSSNAVIETMRRGLQYAKDNKVGKTTDYKETNSEKFIITITIILMGSVLPLFLRHRNYRTVQLALNVIVLGLWSGSFISYSLLVNYVSNGINPYTSASFILLLTVAFIFPLFRRKSHYCNWICPFGSLQELAGRSSKYKFRLTPILLKYLNLFREILWATLMLFMWSGIMFKWMDYEIFVAFMLNEASTIVIIVAAAFCILSCFVNRPYCRFVCPTGNLIRLSQNTK